MIRRIIATRRGAAYVGVMLMLTLLALWQGKSAVLFNFTLLRPPVRLPYSEICALVAAAVGAIMLRSRFWQWERTAGPRAKGVAVAAAAAGCVAPMLVVAVSLLAIPETYWASWRLCNALILSSSVFLLAPLLSPAVAGALVILLYFAHGILVNIWSDLAWIPLTRFPESDFAAVSPHWIVATLLLLAALTVNGGTNALSVRAQRTFDRDE